MYFRSLKKKCFAFFGLFFKKTLIFLFFFCLLVRVMCDVFGRGLWVCSCDGSAMAEAQSFGEKPQHLGAVG
jgi:hypothetical protein